MQIMACLSPHSLKEQHAAHRDRIVGAFRKWQGSIKSPDYVQLLDAVCSRDANTMSSFSGCMSTAGSAGGRALTNSNSGIHASSSNSPAARPRILLTSNSSASKTNNTPAPSSDGTADAGNFDRSSDSVVATLMRKQERELRQLEALRVMRRNRTSWMSDVTIDTIDLQGDDEDGCGDGEQLSGSMTWASAEGHASIAEGDEGSQLPEEGELAMQPRAKSSPHLHTAAAAAAAGAGVQRSGSRTSSIRARSSSVGSSSRRQRGGHAAEGPEGAASPGSQPGSEVRPAPQCSACASPRSLARTSTASSLTATGPVGAEEEQQQAQFVQMLAAARQRQLQEHQQQRQQQRRRSSLHHTEPVSQQLPRVSGAGRGPGSGGASSGADSGGSSSTLRRLSLMLPLPTSSPAASPRLPAAGLLSPRTSQVTTSDLGAAAAAAGPGSGGSTAAGASTAGAGGAASGAIVAAPAAASDASPTPTPPPARSALSLSLPLLPDSPRCSVASLDGGSSSRSFTSTMFGRNSQQPLASRASLEVVARAKSECTRQSSSLSGTVAAGVLRGGAGCRECGSECGAISPGSCGPASRRTATHNTLEAEADSLLLQRQVSGLGQAGPPARRASLVAVAPPQLASPRQARSQSGPIGLWQHLQQVSIAEPACPVPLQPGLTSPFAPLSAPGNPRTAAAADFVPHPPDSCRPPTRVRFKLSPPASPRGVGSGWRGTTERGVSSDLDKLLVVGGSSSGGGRSTSRGSLSSRLSSGSVTAGDDSDPLLLLTGPGSLQPPSVPGRPDAAMPSPSPPPTASDHWLYAHYFGNHVWDEAGEGDDDVAGDHGVYDNQATGYVATAINKAAPDAACTRVDATTPTGHGAPVDHKLWDSAALSVPGPGPPPGPRPPHPAPHPPAQREPEGCVKEAVPIWR